MDRVGAFGKYHLLDTALAHAGVEELFTCMEVSQLWQLAAIHHLRRRLTYVEVPCPTAKSETKARAEFPFGSPEYHLKVFSLALERRLRLAAVAGMQPGALFIFNYGNFLEHVNTTRIRSLLPPDCPIVHLMFTSGLYRCNCDTREHSIMLAGLLFKAHKNRLAYPARMTSETEQVDTLPATMSTSTVPVPEGHPGGENVEDGDSEPEDQFEEGADNDLVLRFGTGLPNGPDQLAQFSLEEFATGTNWSNAFPGWITLKAIRFEQPSLGIRVTTTSFTERTTGRTIQVKSAAIFKKMSERRLVVSLDSFRDNIGSVTSRFAVHLQFGRFKATTGECVLGCVFEHILPQVPIMHFHGSSANVPFPGVPLVVPQHILLSFKLLQ